MLRQSSERDEAAAASDVERLLALLQQEAKGDPSPTLRIRLEQMASAWLAGRRRLARRRFTLRWAFAGMAGAVILAALLLALHADRHSDSAAGTEARIIPLTAPSVPAVRREAVRRAASASMRKHAVQHTMSGTLQFDRLVAALPYSDSAVATGTATTIQVSVSRDELMSLGFPANAMLEDRRVMAEVTLGDDGLPRAISVPLPFGSGSEMQ